MENNYLNPKETTSALAEISIKKTSYKYMDLVVLGILAGAYIAFGAHFATTVTSDISSHVGFGITKLLGGLTFSIGLIMVVITGAELFTGNNLLLIGLLDKKVAYKQLLKNWIIVYLANFIGAVLVALLIYFTQLNGKGDILTPVGKTAVAIANTKVTLDFGVIFARAILANWLVCLAVFMAVASKDFVGKILACLIPITAFVSMGFEHSIANMYYITIGLLTNHGVIKSLTIENGLSNLLASTLGNIVGGLVFVAVAYWFVFLRKQSLKS